MPNIQDNRIQFPPTLIDFVNVVGETGQAHDNFPAPGQQARYDWARLYWLGLLANQSSKYPPTQYRVGTLWYDRSSSVDIIRVWTGVSWQSLGDIIQVGVDIHSNPVTLTMQMAAVSQKLLAVQPRLTFSGYSINKNVTQNTGPTDNHRCYW